MVSTKATRTPTDDDDVEDDLSVDKQHLSDEEVQNLVSSAIDDAANHIDSDISPERARLMSQYEGEPYGDEEPGRSSFVSREIFDTVQGQLPDIVRVLLGPERVCAYRPDTDSDIQWTREATQYAEQVVSRDNDGFGIFYAAIKDALITKVGFLKAWWEDNTDVRWEYYTSITRQQMLLLADYEELEIAVISPSEGTEYASDPQTGESVPLALDVEVKRRINNGRIAFAALPPEEFLISSGATSMNDAEIVAHRTEKTVGELVAMGYSRETVEKYAANEWYKTNAEELERGDYGAAFNEESSEAPLAQHVDYVEAYMRVDLDGDDIPELMKFCTLGGDHEIVHKEPAEIVPFVDLQADPIPHTFFGASTAEKVEDLQQISTSIQRNMLDSLAQSVHPRTGIVEGQVNMDDVLNNEVGGVIRQRAPGMVQDLSTNFVGREAMPVLDHMDNLREMRTGVTRQSLGLDADALQSTTESAVQQSITGSQGKIEIICRVMANGLKKLYEIILHLAVRNQDWVRTLQVEGEHVQVDPRTWHVDASVDIELAMGGGTIQERMKTLQGIMFKQEQIFQTFGLNQPIVEPRQYSNALRKWAQLAGWQNPDQFFNEVPRDWQPPQPPPPEPNIEQQIELQKVHNDQLKIQNEATAQQRDDEITRDKNIAETILKRQEMHLKYGTQLTEAAVEAASGQRQAETKAEVDMAQTALKTESAEATEQTKQLMAEQRAQAQDQREELREEREIDREVREALRQQQRDTTNDGDQ